jgi:hypothetical protein
MRAARDVQARNAFVDQHRDRLEAALSTAINALADARPEKWPLTYLGRWLLEQGAKQSETPPVGEVDARSEVPEALRPLQKRAAEALGPIKSAAEGDDEHAVKLPEALNTFKTLAKTEAIEAACGRLHGLELNVARAPDSEEAVDALRAQLIVVDKEMATEIQKRTEGVGEEAAKAMVKACQTAIDAGNKDFQSVYGSVFNVIKSGDADGMAKYEVAVGVLDAAIEKPAVAEQRDEAGVAAVLFADAARVKSSFDVVVRELKAATGAGLELAVLSAKEDTGASDGGGAGQGEERKAKTGLKKSSRVVEKSALRPGEGRGQSKWVCDVVRAMLVATSMSAVGSIVRGLLALHQAGALRVVRIKDRFAQPSAGGWRDLMVNFVIVSDPTRHVCEVQVVHEMMLTARKGLPGHAIYGIVRSAMELIESCGRERELRREAVRSMVAAGATDVELIGASEDAWILEDPVWAAGVEGGRDVLCKEVLKVDKEEGRVVGLELSGKKWKGEALPASVARLTALRKLTIRDCKSLKSVAVLPASVTQIGEDAFRGCTSLVSITLPASVTQIGGGAFYGCTSLASITLPASVTEIGARAFFDCTSLASITLPASVTEIGEQAFRGCASLASITIPASVTQIGQDAFKGCTSLASITLPASVTQIGWSTFSGCTSLASITIPESVTQIGEDAFRGCTSLVSITLPASVTQIGGGAFFGCTSLASITLPASVTEIGACAFYGCASLASITIPESVTEICGYAFYDCTSLASISIPSSTVVEPGAFSAHTQVTRA